MRSFPALAVVVAASIALAEDAAPTNTAEYEKAHQYDCNGPLEKLSAPDVKELGNYRYDFLGGTVKARRKTKRKGAEVKIGVLAGLKEPDVKQNLEEFLAEFHKQDVEVVFVGGDTAEQPEDLDVIYAMLAEKTQLPILAIAGNTERGGAHNYAIQKLRDQGKLNLINMDMVRRFDGDGFDVASLGGYYDKTYVHATGVCIYSAADVAVIAAAAKESDDPVVLLTHGPPRQEGKEAIDFVPGAGNVGDPALTDVIKEAKIAFGVHGHILEAAARATDLAGKPVPEKKLLKSFFLNPGSANPLPWKLNSGTTSYGLAAVVTMKGKEAKYEVLKAPKR
jgi:Icc-related predicted phosphoesterase